MYLLRGPLFSFRYLHSFREQLAHCFFIKTFLQKVSKHGYGRRWDKVEYRVTKSNIIRL